MARKPGKPIRQKRTAKPKRNSKTGGKVRRRSESADPIVTERARDRDTDDKAAAGAEDAHDDNAPIEVSEFRPVESTDADATAESVGPGESSRQR